MSEIIISEKNISESLKIVLLKKSLNVSKLADRMGVSSTTLYSKFKRGVFSNKDLDDICQALGISYEVSFKIDTPESNA
ncbi:MAG: helix-turn-helix domain-containing protein [Parasporobacterium sp.]|nr:helix-turn-helix domain-containing protein [Parasporobacterium sp.]